MSPIFRGRSTILLDLRPWSWRCAKCSRKPRWTRTIFGLKSLPATNSALDEKLCSQEHILIQVKNMATDRPVTKILVDGGDPEETLRIKKLIGFVDGQTPTPSLIAKNPEVRRLVASGHRFSSQEETAEYRKIVQA